MKVKVQANQVGHLLGGPMDGRQVELSPGTKIGDIRTLKYWSVGHWSNFNYRVTGFRFRPEQEFILRPEII